MKRLFLALLVALLPAVAMGQQTIVQGGSWTPGQTVTYSTSGVSQPILSTAGPAGGGGQGISELPIIARGTGLPPFVAQGSGPLGTINCVYDGPVSSAAGYHYVCLSANAHGGALLTTGAAGGASPIGLNFVVDGTTYPFPFGGGGGGGGIVGPGTTVSGDVVCWNNNVGTLVKDCGGTIQFSGSTSGTTTLSSQAVASGILLLPNGTDTLVARTSTDTLTNKTLTTPTINGGTINTPTIVSATITSPSITSPTISNAVITTATITGGAMGSASTAATQSPGDNTTLLATDAFVQQAVGLGMPIGACVSYGGASAPTNWVFAFGQAVSRTTFATLFSAYGIAYGAGDGTTTFNMPDLRGRLLAGLDNMGGSAASRMTVTSMTPNGTTLGATGGAQTVGVAFTSTGTNNINLGSGQTGSTSGGWSGSAPVAAGADFNALTTSSISATTNTTPIIGNVAITVSGGATVVDVQPTLLMNTICKVQ